MASDSSTQRISDMFYPKEKERDGISIDIESLLDEPIQNTASLELVRDSGFFTPEIICATWSHWIYQLI